MKNLIIGGSGFVGSFLIESLEKKETKNYDKNQSLYFKNLTTIGNILDINKLRKVMVGVESVVLLAAEHRDDVSPTKLYYDVNVTGTKNVLDLMDEIGIKKLIFTSTVAVYGLNKLNPNEKLTITSFISYVDSVSDQDSINYNWPGVKVTLADYTLASINANYKLNKYAQYYLTIMNVLDEEYETIAGYNVPDLSVYTGIRLSF